MAVHPLMCTIEGIKRASELRMTRRLVVIDDGEDLLAVPPESSEELTFENGEGDPEDVFIFGLHNPFDGSHSRQFRIG